MRVVPTRRTAGGPAPSLQAVALDNDRRMLVQFGSLTGPVIFIHHGSAGSVSSAREKFQSLESRIPNATICYMEGNATGHPQNPAWAIPNGIGIDQELDIDYVENADAYLASLGYIGDRYAVGFSAGGNFVQWLGVRAQIRWRGLGVFSWKVTTTISSFTPQITLEDDCEQFLSHGMQDPTSVWLTTANSTLTGPDTETWMDGRGGNRTSKHHPLGHDVQPHCVEAMIAAWGILS